MKSPGKPPHPSVPTLQAPVDLKQASRPILLLKFVALIVYFQVAHLAGAAGARLTFSVF
jgi:hypothetical protein